MHIITSESFFNEWLSVVNNDRSLLLAQWGNWKEYTKLIKSSEKCIIQQVATNLGLKCYPKDYYFIDSVLYADGDLVPNIKENTFWLRQIKVAFEHENNFSSGLYQEVAHLLLIQATLKVLITYPNQETAKELTYLHKIIKGCDHQKDISDKENFLLIFGSEDEFKWEGLVYNMEGWKPLVIHNYLEQK